MSDLAPSGQVYTLAARVAAFLALTHPVNAAVAPILINVITQVIPHRKMDRMEGILERVVKRLDRLDPPIGGERPFDPVFPELLEDGFMHAGRAASPERLDYIAAMIVNGISGGTARRLDHRHLMQLLGEMNDVEVLLLIHAGQSGEDADRFWRRHEQALSVPIDGPAATPEERERAAVFESYLHHLERLGVVQLVPFAGWDKDYSGTREDGYISTAALRVTTLGEVLLRSMSQAPTTLLAQRIHAKLPEARLRAIWEELTPLLREVIAAAQSTASSKNVLLQSSFQDIHVVVTCEGRDGRKARLQGFIHPLDNAGDDQLRCWALFLSNARC